MTKRLDPYLGPFHFVLDGLRARGGLALDEATSKATQSGAVSNTLLIPHVVHVRIREAWSRWRALAVIGTAVHVIMMCVLMLESTLIEDSVSVCITGRVLGA